jgi:subtilisin-like proprotein convertase family protein
VSNRFRVVSLAALTLSLAAADPVRAQTFSNPTGFAIPASSSAGAAALYPSEILVSGIQGAVGKVTATLTLSHQWPADVDILLVGPQGQNVVLMSDSGSSVSITDVVFTFDDDAANALGFGGPLVSGTYRPTNLGGTGSDGFPAPAPALSGATTLATFTGTNPNGLWSLYVYDDDLVSTGSLGGWSLTFVPEPGAAGQGAALLAVLALQQRRRSAARG